MTEFQSRSSTQGAAFEEIVCQHLTFMEGWTILERHLVVNGLEVDIHATDPFGIEHWIECKGVDGRSKLSVVPPLESDPTPAHGIARPEVAS